jgi:DNA-binding MltR family transcriptional regulator
MMQNNLTNNYRTDLNEYKWNSFYEEFQNESPRAAVIIAGAFLDDLLRDILSSFFISNKKVVNELLGTENNADTPLSSFSARIKLVYCLGFLSQIEYDDLLMIKKIRNRFAHKRHEYTFNNDEIISYCNKLKIPLMFDQVIPKMDNHYAKFSFSVFYLSTQLGFKIFEAEKERRNNRGNPEIGQVVRAE